MLRLERITGQNVWEILALRVREDQRNFVADNTQSIIEAYIAITGGGHAFPLGIYTGDTPVGFLMIGYGVDADWTDAPSIADGNYSFWRLMVDQRYQGHGYGRAAIRLALDFIRTRPCGAADCCWLSCHPNNHIAGRLYRSCGFRETGDWDGDEVIMTLALED